MGCSQLETNLSPYRHKIYLILSNRFFNAARLIIALTIIKTDSMEVHESYEISVVSAFQPSEFPKKWDVLLLR